MPGGFVGMRESVSREANSESRCDPLRVLIIDDEPLIGTTLRILLEGYDVTVVLSGTQARQTLASGASFDAILCDLTLADISGMELAAWLERARPELKERVIYMTGGAFTDEARDFLRTLPRSRRLEKPFSSEEIHRALRSVA